MKAFISGIGLVIIGLILTSTQRIISAVYIAGNMHVSKSSDPFLNLGMIFIIIGIVLWIKFPRK